MEKIRLFQDLMPASAAWSFSVTKIIVPHASASKHTCSSDPTLPGLVWINLTDPNFVLEGLIHESAHKHFDIEESNHELALETKKEFWSDLKNDFRTFRSILIAHHALAYIAAFYREAETLNILPRNYVRNELADVLFRLRRSARTLAIGHKYFTAPGIEFLEKTDDVWKCHN